jgi:hypothetical protein
MTRRPPSGTPTRATGYLFPGRGGRLLGASLVAGMALAAALLGVYFAGAGGLLSPGPVASPHAPIGGDCTLCHAVGRAVQDLRCERCHDAAATQRLSNQAHVLFGSSDARKAAGAEDIACARCHTEHRGRAQRLATADDRECATCHAFASLRAHPEFAAVSANVQTGLGLKFPHERHLAADAANGVCDFCHVPTPELAGFEPISFEQHCATCHVDGQGRLRAETAAIQAELLVGPGQVPPAWRQELIATQQQARDRLVITGMVHRDPWVRYNAIKLRREVDPLADRQERTVLEAQRAWLQQQLRARPLRDTPTSSLTALQATLQQDIAALEAAMAAPGAGAGGETDLQALAGAMEAIAAGLGELLDEPARGPVAAAGASLAALRAELEEAAGGAAAAAPATAADATAFEAQRAELRRLLDAVAARGDAALTGRTAGLRGRLDALQPAGGPQAAPTTDQIGALQDHLDGLDEALRTAASGADLGGRYEAARIDVLRALARQRVGDGLAPADYEARRQEVLDLLDVIERRGDESIRLRAAHLRQQAIEARPGDAGDAGRQRRLGDLRELLARVELEIELAGGAGGARHRPLAFGSLRDGVAIEAALERIDARLDELRSGPRSNAASLPDERAARSRALQSLLGPCLKCHEMSGSALDPVQVARPVLTRSAFSHAPHVTQTSCGSCHGDATAAGAGERLVFESGRASDVNVPGIGNCRACHAPAQVNDECEVCHRYHPPSITSLLEAR